MQSHTFDSTDAVPAPAANYALAVRRGPILAVSGQVAFLPGQLLGPAPDIEAQARVVFDNLRHVLSLAGATFADVVMVRIYLAHEEDFGVLNAVFNEVFDKVRPARTTVWVHLPGGLLVEVDLLAVLDD